MFWGTVESNDQGTKHEPTGVCFHRGSQFTTSYRLHGDKKNQTLMLIWVGAWVSHKCCVLRTWLVSGWLKCCFLLAGSKDVSQTTSCLSNLGCFSFVPLWLEQPETADREGDTWKIFAPSTDSLRPSLLPLLSHLLATEFASGSQITA